MTNMNKLINPSIYGLTVDGRIFFYVGSTKKNSKNRLWEHIYRANNGHNAPVYHYMREVGPYKVQVVDLTSTVGVADVAVLEAKIIRQFLDEGHPLTNQLGRDGVPGSMGDEAKRRMSEDRKGKPTWIKGKRGVEAGWTDERRAAFGKRVSESKRARTQ
jgi:hypothetical protein